MIKECFVNFFLHQSDFTVDLHNNQIEIHKSNVESWKITLVDTGLNSMTGGRIKRIAKYVNNETFMLTYGDGVGNVNIKDLFEHHRKEGKSLTVTAVQPTGRFGSIKID